MIQCLNICSCCLILLSYHISASVLTITLPPSYFADSFIRLEPSSVSPVFLSEQRLRYDSLPGGNYKLFIGRYGANQIFYHYFTLRDNDTLNLELTIQDDSIQAVHECSEVIIEAKRDPTSSKIGLGQFRLRHAMINDVPLSLGDVSRILKSLPGTSRYSDWANDLLIRGGSPWENSYYIENIRVNELNYFQRQSGSGGALGYFDLHSVSELVFYNGNMPVSYGGAMSGVMALTLKKNEELPTERILSLGLSGVRASATGHFFSNQWDYHFSVQRGYLDWLNRLLGNDVAPGYESFQGFLHGTLATRHQLSLLVVAAYSDLNFDLATAIKNGYNGALNLSHTTGTVGVNWQFRVTSRAISELSFSHSPSENRDRIWNAATEMTHYAIMENIGNTSIRHHFTFDPALRHKINVGYEIDWENFSYTNYFAATYNRYGNQQVEVWPEGRLSVHKIAFYIQFTALNSRGFQYNVGARVLRPSYQNRLTVDPRLSLERKWGDGFSLGIGSGVYHQPLPLFLLAANQANRRLSQPVCIHYNIRLARETLWGGMAELELYAKDYRHQPLTHEDPAIYVMDSGINYGFYRFYEELSDRGVAFVKGVEIGFSRRLLRKGRFNASLNFFRSEYHDWNGVERPRLGDNRFIFLCDFLFYIAAQWQLNIHWEIAGGTPYTPFDEVASQDAQVGIIDSRYIHEMRYRNYHSLNFQLQRTFRVNHSQLNLLVGVINVYYHRNEARIYWNKLTQRTAMLYQAPFLPVFSVSWIF